MRSVVCEHDQSKEAAFWVMVETVSSPVSVFAAYRILSKCATPGSPRSTKSVALLTPVLLVVVGCGLGVVCKCCGLVFDGMWGGSEGGT